MGPKSHELYGIGEGDAVNVPLEPIHVACARHMEPFQATWPAGYELFAIELFNTLVNDRRSMLNIDADKIMDVLAERPLCEHVSISDLKAAYIKCGVSTVAACEVCSTVRAGTTYRSARPGGGITEYKHLCLDCMLTRFRPLN